MNNVKYKRILLKLSGEVLAGTDKSGLNEKVVENICKNIKEVTNMGVEIAIVIGGGNFWRGRNSEHIERSTADYMGMLATILNGLALEDALNFYGVPSVLETSIEMNGITETFNLKNALKHLNEKKVVIFAGGTGHPYFTTDTAAALRAIEINADILLLGKSIDGVYSSDPEIDKNAIKYDEISYTDILKQDLKVMDSTATSMCRDNSMPLLVFGIDEPENIIKAIKGEKIGTVVVNK